MQEAARDKLHEQVARRLHSDQGDFDTVAALEALRQEGLTARPLDKRRKAAETYKALTGRKP